MLVAAAGRAVVNHLCEHFALSRTELLAFVKVKEQGAFHAVLAACGTG